MYAIYMKFAIEKQTADGSIIKTITKETLTDFVIQIPQIQEQQKIVNILNYFEQKITKEELRLQYLSCMKNGLMQQLFI